MKKKIIEQEDKKIQKFPVKRAVNFQVPEIKKVKPN